MSNLDSFNKPVLAVDVLDRYIDENGVLKTTRLVLKKGKAPKWFPENVTMQHQLDNRHSTNVILSAVSQELRDIHH